MSHLVAPLELLFVGGEDFADDEQFDYATANPRTIGIGDGGNEVGMGKIYDRVTSSAIPNAKEIACVVPSDHIIVASVSNWGIHNFRFKYSSCFTLFSFRWLCFGSCFHVLVVSLNLRRRQLCRPNRK